MATTGRRRRRAQYTSDTSLPAGRSARSGSCRQLGRLMPAASRAAVSATALRLRSPAPFASPVRLRALHYLTSVIYGTQSSPVSLFPCAWACPSSSGLTPELRTGTPQDPQRAACCREGNRERRGEAEEVKTRASVGQAGLTSSRHGPCNHALQHPPRSFSNLQSNLQSCNTIAPSKARRYEEWIALISTYMPADLSLVACGAR
jgi:hypothetical protein